MKRKIKKEALSKNTRLKKDTAIKSARQLIYKIYATLVGVSNIGDIDFHQPIHAFLFLHINYISFHLYFSVRSCTSISINQSIHSFIFVHCIFSSFRKKSCTNNAISSFNGMRWLKCQWILTYQLMVVAQPNVSLVEVINKQTRKRERASEWETEW